MKNIDANKSNLFNELSVKKYNELLDQGSKRRMHPREILFREGDLAKNCGILHMTSKVLYSLLGKAPANG